MREFFCRGSFSRYSIGWTELGHSEAYDLSMGNFVVGSHSRSKCDKHSDIFNSAVPMGRLGAGGVSVCSSLFDGAVVEETCEDFVYFEVRCTSNVQNAVPGPGSSIVRASSSDSLSDSGRSSYSTSASISSDTSCESYEVRKSAGCMSILDKHAFPNRTCFKHEVLVEGRYLETTAQYAGATSIFINSHFYDWTPSQIHFVTEHLRHHFDCAEKDPTHDHISWVGDWSWRYADKPLLEVATGKTIFKEPKLPK